MHDDTFAILRCPDDHSTLAAADGGLIARLNAAVRAGQLRNQAGLRVDYAIEGGLVRAAGDLLYPIVDAIPVMLHDEAIPLDQLR